MNVFQARALRSKLSPPEARLWRHLRQRPGGFQFRRQHPEGPYIFDFYCRSATLAIEVDGLAHSLGNNPERDEQRDRWAASRGIRTLRIAALDVRDNLDGVIAGIVDACLKRTPPPRFTRSPSPRNRGEDMEHP